MKPQGCNNAHFDQGFHALQEGVIDECEVMMGWKSAVENERNRERRTAPEPHCHEFRVKPTAAVPEVTF
jgi:hypothetical protein